MFVQRFCVPMRIMPAMARSTLPAIVKANIKALLEKQGLSATNASVAAGLGPNNLTQAFGSERGMNLQTLDQISAVLGVAPRDLLNPPGGPQTPAPVTGFSEARVTPFQRPAADDAPAPEDTGFKAEFTVSGHDAAGIGLSAGDLLEIDMSQPPTDGALVIATIINRETGAARSVIGRKLGPYLVGPSFGTRPADHALIDNDRVSILATVRRVLRDSRS